jgi:hypothetical protein
MKKSVLIIGPNYFNYLQASEYAFSKLGYNVVTDGYDTPIHPYTSFMKLRYKVSRDKDGLYRKSVNLYNSHIINLFNNTKPSIVFIMNGEILNSETLEYMRRDAKVVKIGNVVIGGNNPVAIQSMLSVPSWDIERSGAQA